MDKPVVEFRIGADNSHALIRPAFVSYFRRKIDRQLYVHNNYPIPLLYISFCLKFKKVRIKAVLLQQLKMRALLDDMPVSNDKYFIC